MMMNIFNSAAFTPDSHQRKTQNIQLFFLQNPKKQNTEYYTTVLLDRFHLNRNTIGLL